MVAIFHGGEEYVGLGCAAVMGTDPAPLDIAWRMALCGIGYGLFQSPNNRSIQSSAPRERSGAPQAIQSIARVGGQTTGAVIVAIVFAIDGRVTGHTSGITPGAVVTALTMATACALLAALASLWRGIETGSIRFAKAQGT